MADSVENWYLDLRSRRYKWKLTPSSANWWWFDKIQNCNFFPNDCCFLFKILKKRKAIDYFWSYKIEYSQAFPPKMIYKMGPHHLKVCIWLFKNFAAWFFGAGNDFQSRLHHDLPKAWFTLVINWCKERSVLSVCHFMNYLHVDRLLSCIWVHILTL